MNRTDIDFVSFSGSPVLLERCKEMAKQRFAISQINEFQSQNVVAIAHREKTQVAYFMENLASVLGCDERNEFANSDLYFAAADKQLQDCDLVIDASKSFKECYDSLIANIGIDMLDVLCHGEIESFLEVLQNEISYEGNHWEIQRKGGGFSGYRHSAKLLCNGTQAGLVAWGASNFGFYVSFSGKGCEAVNMAKLQYALQQMPSVKLTRVDICLDDMHGNVSINDIKERYCNGEFITRGTPPSWGEFWGGRGMSKEDRKKCGLVPDAGHTFYVGARENGKIFRAYHKGAQLKSQQFPDWNRFEVQIGNRYRVIPLDVLTDSDKYFAGAYPALSNLIPSVAPVAIPTVKVQFQTTLENAIKHAKTQYGKLINLMAQLYADEKNSHEKIIKRLTEGLDITDIPDRINFPVGRALTAINLE